MDDFKIMGSRIKILLTIQKLEMTLNEIKENRPNATEYINGITQSILDLADSHQAFQLLEQELKVAKQRNLDLEIINLKQMQQITELENEIKAMKF